MIVETLITYVAEVDVAINTFRNIVIAFKEV